MASLTNVDKLYLEQYLEMSDGYVLDFSNKTFTAFVFKHTELDIYADKYLCFGTSKAKRLRAFWQEESNAVVAKLIKSLLDHIESKNKIIPELHDRCLEIVKNLEIQEIFGHENSSSQNRELYNLSMNKWHILHSSLLLETHPIRKMQLEVDIRETKQKCIEFAKLLGEACPLEKL